MVLSPVSANEVLDQMIFAVSKVKTHFCGTVFGWSEAVPHEQGLVALKEFP
jgi:hypothetical protein